MLQLVRVEPYIWVANMIGQHGTKTNRSVGAPIRYDAVDQCLQTLASSSEHPLWLDIAKPAKGLKVELRYGDCGIRNVNVVDFIASAQPTRLMKSPTDARCQLSSLVSTAGSSRGRA